MAIQGKCTKCKKRFEWLKDVLGKFCGCPYCGRKLESTTCLLKKWPTIRLKKPGRVIYGKIG